LQHKAAFPLQQARARRAGTAYRINSFATNKMYGKTSGFRSPTMPTKYMMYAIYPSTVTETKNMEFNEKEHYSNASLET
jgi:hypothetical protein